MGRWFLRDPVVPKGFSHPKIWKTVKESLVDAWTKQSKI